MGFQIQPIRCNVVNNSVLKTAFVSRFHYPKWPQKQSYPSMFFCAKNQGDQNYFFLNHIFGGSNLIVPHYVIEQIFFLLHKNSFYCITIANFFWAKISKSCSFWSPWKKTSRRDVWCKVKEREPNRKRPDTNFLGCESFFLYYIYESFPNPTFKLDFFMYGFPYILFELYFPEEFPIKFTHVFDNIWKLKFLLNNNILN